MSDPYRDLAQGKLEQACSGCGRVEAAGRYCTGCRAPMGPDDWYRNGQKDRRAGARERAAEIDRTRVKRGPGRPRRASTFDGTLGLA